VIISGELVTEQLSSVTNAETKKKKKTLGGHSFKDDNEAEIAVV